MKVLRVVTSRMVAKIFLVIGLVVGAALLLQARADGRRIERTLKSETHIAAERLAQLVIGAVEHSMLAGDGIQVRRLVRDLIDRLPGAEIHIYDRRGIEVFAPPPAPPEPGSLPAELRAALDGTPRQVTAEGTVVRAIPSDQRCVRCHDDGEPVRGALAVTLDPTGCAQRRDYVFAQLVEHGFTQLMTAEQAGSLDDYFSELADVSGALRAVAVYDAQGDRYFGAEKVASAEAIGQALEPGATPRLLTATGGGVTAMVPLPMTERCTSCHDEPVGTVRGVLAVDLAPPSETDCGPGLELAIDHTLRFIMVTALGRRVADFLDAMVAGGGVERLDLFDNHGRRRWTTNHSAPPPDVATVIAARTGSMSFHGSGQSEQVSVVEPLHNRRGCQRCHGGEDELRGAVSVALSTAAAARARAETVQESTWLTGYTLAGVLLILVALLQYLVVRPVNRIGQVADQVGLGNLDVVVDRAHPDGDEVARLGLRVNEMVRGLRAKSNLEKLVSRGAAEAAASSMVLRGELRRFTVLFSDIRGFTSYAEEHSPSEVVGVLNRLLAAQSKVVHEHGGDIDKFVGDELMALFSGPDAERRALACAVDMIEAVAACDGGELSVGVGIHAGEVVYGAIGAEDRLDFTVIGDVVNTAARLCSAARGAEILVSKQVAEAGADLPEVELSELEPVELKGKRKPFPVWQARRSDA